MSMNVSLGGFSKTERTCVRMGSAKVLITVIVPTYDNSLWIHEFNTDLTFFNFVWKLLTEADLEGACGACAPRPP